MADAVIVSAARLPDLALNSAGRPDFPLVFVDLASAEPALAEAAARTAVVTVGVNTGGASEPSVRDALSLTLTTASPAGPAEIHVEDLDAACAEISAAVHEFPRAAMALNRLLRTTSVLTVADGLAVESSVYSMLLTGPEFALWRRGRPPKADPVPGVGAAVLVQRHGDVLQVILNRPERHNAFDRHVRDGLIDAFDLALLDPTIAAVEVRGHGESFCSGGDLDEFGSSADVTTAHLIRLDRSVAARLHRCRDRTTVYLHGACLGAGIEIPSYAARVVAAADTAIRLPEIAMGLIPGAGGTVGITRRIGRWRTAWLALTGHSLTAGEALDWGLVDALGD